MKLALTLLLLAPLAFAASGWEGTAALAIVASAALLGIAYAVGTGFSISKLQMIAKEELLQLVATVVLLIALVGGNNVIDSVSADLAGLAGATDLQTAAEATITKTLTDPANGLETLYNGVTSYDTDIEKEGTKMLSCNILGIGYSVSACGGFGMLHTPLTIAGSILGFAIGESYSILMLIALAKAYAMNLFLPLGILLRTFKITRGAGGFLIALGVSLYVMLPFGIIFNQIMADTFLDPALNPGAPAFTAGLSTTIESCDPSNVNGAQIVGSEGEKVRVMLDGFRTDLRGVVFSVLVLGTFGPVIALMMTVSSIKALSSLAGAEVDVSPLGRLL